MQTHASHRSGRARRVLAAAAVLSAVALPLPARAAASEAADTTEFAVIPGPLGFGEAPGVVAAHHPSGVKGRTAAIGIRMDDFAITVASGAPQGWLLTVNRSTRRTPPNSLMLNSRGAQFVPQGGTSTLQPSNRCDLGCFLDAPPLVPSKIASASAGAGLGTFRTSGFSASSLRLARPASALPRRGGGVYRVALSWTLNTGP